MSNYNFFIPNDIKIIKLLDNKIFSFKINDNYNLYYSYERYKLLFLIDNESIKYKIIQLKLFIMDRNNVINDFDSKIDNLQIFLRQQISSISNIFIIKKTDNYYNCMYYPTFLRKLIPNNITIYSNLCSLLSNKIMLENNTIKKSLRDNNLPGYDKLDTSKIIDYRERLLLIKQKTEKLDNNIKTINEKIQEKTKEHERIQLILNSNENQYDNKIDELDTIINRLENQLLKITRETNFIH